MRLQCRDYDHSLHIISHWVRKWTWHADGHASAMCSKSLLFSEIMLMRAINRRFTFVVVTFRPRRRLVHEQTGKQARWVEFFMLFEWRRKLSPGNVEKETENYNGARNYVFTRSRNARVPSWALSSMLVAHFKLLLRRRVFVFWIRCERVIVCKNGEKSVNWGFESLLLFKCRMSTLYWWMIGESFYGSCENDLKQTIESFFQDEVEKLGSSLRPSRRLIGFNLGVVQTAR